MRELGFQWQEFGVTNEVGISRRIPSAVHKDATIAVGLQRLECCDAVVSIFPGTRDH